MKDYFGEPRDLPGPLLPLTGFKRSGEVIHWNRPTTEICKTSESSKTCLMAGPLKGPGHLDEEAYLASEQSYSVYKQTKIKNTIIS